MYFTGRIRSRPRNELRENTTWDFVNDIEKLRNFLHLDKIILFGGSWGSTLSLAYAETYPENVRNLILRGVYLATKEADHHVWQSGIPRFFPEIYDSILVTLPDSLLPPGPDNNYKVFQIEDSTTRQKCIKILSRHYDKASRLYVPDEELDKYYASDSNNEDIFTIMLFDTYYMSTGAFLQEDQLLKDAYKIKDIPTIIINGRYDLICPPIFAYQLHKKMPKSKYVIVEKAGHTMNDKPIERELLKAMKQIEETFPNL